MKLRLGNPEPPRLVEGPAGEDVLREAVSDDSLLALAEGSAAVLLVAPGEALPRAARRLGDVLAAARAGRLPASSDDLYRSGAQLLADARLTLRDRAGRYVVAGRALRPGADGEETVAVVALVPAPIAAAQVRVDLHGPAA
jgi:hypothetical protein